MYGALNKMGMTGEGDSYKVVKGEVWSLNASKDSREVDGKGVLISGLSLASHFTREAG